MHASVITLLGIAAVYWFHGGPCNADTVVHDKENVF